MSSGLGGDLKARLQAALGVASPAAPAELGPPRSMASYGPPQADNRAVLDSCEGPHRFAHAPGGTPPRTMRCSLCGGWADPYWVGGYELGRVHGRREREGT